MPMPNFLTPVTSHQPEATLCWQSCRLLLTGFICAAQVVDMEVMTASAPANPITPVTFIGFEFAPKENYYETFQAGVLAKLAVRFPSLIRCLSRQHISAACSLCLEQGVQQHRHWNTISFCIKCPVDRCGAGHPTC